MNLKIRPMRKDDLPEADYIMRVAFGTFIGVPEPEKFGEGQEHVRTRWLADPNAAFVAEADGKVVGSTLAARWGSFGFFGPLTVHPDFWDKGVAKRLLEPTMALFEKWGVTSSALFTFAHSPKHLGLYRRFGFWPRSLTLVTSKQVQAGGGGVAKWSKFSDVPDADKERYLALCRDVTVSVYSGLDVEPEILAVGKQGLGDTVLLWEGETLVGLAVCHCGPGTEGGREMCFVKFGAVRTGPNAGDAFGRLLTACEELAALKGMKELVAGVNTACEDACKIMMGRGFSDDYHGVLMLRPNEPAFDKPDRYVICDLR